MKVVRRLRAREIEREAKSKKIGIWSAKEE